MRNREKLEKCCLSCGKPIPNRNDFCNNRCQNDYRTESKLKKWLNGENIIQKGGCSIPPWMRRFLLGETNNKCSVCGWGEINPYSNTIPLDVDHIDGDAYNNLKENLRVLCPNCHSLQKTHKNTGKRKSSRNYRNKPS